MAHLQYIPGDPRLVDQLVYELKSKGIFDQFRKDCIADVDTRPAYQNLRQRVENSVSTFLARQCWKPDLNKNQLREKLRKHILDGNYLEQGVERIVDQVVNPKVATVFIPQVEDLVYNYLGITRKKTTPVAETSNGKVADNDLLPTDLEAVSPASVKSNDDKTEAMETSHADEDIKMEVDVEKPKDEKDQTNDVDKTEDTRLSGISELTSNDSMASMDKSSIPLPSEEIKLENIPAPDNSPPKITKIDVELEKIELPEEPDLSRDIPLPNETPKSEKEAYFKPVNSDDDDSSSDSSLRRNMSPLTPIRNFNNENSSDAQQAFENEDNKDDKKDALEPSTFRFTIESKVTENSSDAVKIEKNETEQANLSYQFNNQININTFNTPMYDDSSNSTHLQIDYESDANSKTNVENKVPEPDHNSEDSRKDKKTEERKSGHKSSHRDSHRHSSSKDRRSDSKQSSSKDSRSDRKSSKDDRRSSSKSNTKEKSNERDKKDEKKDRESSKHRSSHKSSSSNSHKDSKSQRSSSSSQRHSSSKHDEKRSSSSSHRDKSDKSSDKYSKEKSSKESRSSSSSTRDKDRKSSSSSKSKSEDKDRQKKDKKDADDHYSASGRGNHTRRSTDRDSNDGSSSSKGSHQPTGSKSTENKKESKSSTSKSDNTSTSGESTSPSDKDNVIDKSKNESKGKNKNAPQVKPIVRIENHLETPISSPPRLPFVPDVTLKKPKFAANMQEARKLMKMRKFLDDEQKRMNQEAALLLEFQANVRPSLSQVYSSIPGPELEFACVTNNQREMAISDSQIHSETANSNIVESSESRSDTISDILTAAEQVENIEVVEGPAGTESIVVDGEIDDEANRNPDTATVQIENIIETDITACEMEVDVSIDENKIEIIDNVSTKTEIINETEYIHTNKADNHDIDSGGDDIEAQLQSLMPDDDVGPEYITVTIIAEELSETEEINVEPVSKINLKPESEKTKICPDEPQFRYFAEHEKYKSELERDTFSKFLKTFVEKSSTDKIHVINCATYAKNILKEVSQNFGQFEIVNYHKNGHSKLNTAKNIVRNVNVSSEITLPIDKVGLKSISPMFSPVKSECSFELSSDYDAKLEEMVSKTSRKEIMEIILGNVIDDPASDCSLELPTIDYCMDSNIERDTENTMKRRFCEVESSVNNNRQVLTPNKIRKLSGSDQISSTTEDINKTLDLCVQSEESSNNNVSNPVRSKYLGRAKRVGLPRPRRSNLPNSPSSDKSVENYEQNTTTPNGRMKPRKVQRYDTSDLYKPKLHYLSRRNNIS